MNDVKNELNWLSKDQTDCLKGIFAVLVLFHHVRAQMSCLNDTIIGMILTAMGFLSVGIFLFFSGYGLETQFKKKGNNYIINMPYTRIIPFYGICIVSIFIYAAERIIMGNYFSLKEFGQSFLFGRTIVQNGWFLQAIILVYFMYYITYRLNFIKSRWLKLGMLLVGYVILCLMLNTSITYYESILAFPLGIYIAQNREVVYGWLFGKFRIIKYLITFTLFSVTLIVGSLDLLGKNFSVIFKMMCVVFFTLLVITLSNLISFENIGTKFLGKIFCEIYIIQGLFISLFHSTYIYIKNEWLYLIVVCCITVAVSWIVHPFFTKIMKSVRNILKNRMQGDEECVK